MYFGCMFGSMYTNINDHLTVVNKSRFVTVFTFTATSCFGMRVFQVLCSNNSNFKPNLGVFNLSGGGLSYFSQKTESVICQTKKKKDSD